MTQKEPQKDIFTRLANNETTEGENTVIGTIGLIAFIVVVILWLKAENKAMPDYIPVPVEESR